MSAVIATTQVTIPSELWLDDNVRDAIVRHLTDRTAAKVGPGRTAYYQTNAITIGDDGIIVHVAAHAENPTAGAAQDAGNEPHTCLGCGRTAGTGPVPGARAFIRLTGRHERTIWLDAERISSVHEYTGRSEDYMSTITVDVHTFHAVEEVAEVMSLIMRVHHLQATGEAL